MTVELEKRYTYIQKFFESLSDEEFVRMMIECGIKSSKKTGREWLYKGVLSKLHEIDLRCGWWNQKGGNNELYQSNGLHRNNIYINSYCNILHMLF